MELCHILIATGRHSRPHSLCPMSPEPFVSLRDAKDRAVVTRMLGRPFIIITQSIFAGNTREEVVRDVQGKLERPGKRERRAW